MKNKETKFISASGILEPKCHPEVARMIEQDAIYSAFKLFIDSIDRQKEYRVRYDVKTVTPNPHPHPDDGPHPFPAGSKVLFVNLEYEEMRGGA